MRILIVTDAWRPQVNGVVRTLEWLATSLPQFGVDVTFLTPEGFRSVPMPGYREIRLALATPSAVAARIEAAQADAIHIATEGPLGILARRFCMREGRAFTTCYHTRFPEYIAARLPIRPAWTYAALRHFHNAASATMAATPALAGDLRARGFRNVVLWRRGIDGVFFRNDPPAALDVPRPIFLTVARLAVEKNVEAFLSLDLPGSKVVVGEGPAGAALARRFPNVHFLGLRHGAELAAIYRAADVFIFPSRTDTFGLVMVEALASGTPVAAYPVEAPQGLLGASECGILDEDLGAAALRALAIPRAACRAFGAPFTMSASARSFLDLAEAALQRSAGELPTPSHVAAA